VSAARWMVVMKRDAGRWLVLAVYYEPEQKPNR
jgi:hypothetical protein